MLHRPHHSLNWNRIPSYAYHLPSWFPVRSDYVKEEDWTGRDHECHKARSCTWDGVEIKIKPLSTQIVSRKCLLFLCLEKDLLIFFFFPIPLLCQIGAIIITRAAACDTPFIWGWWRSPAIVIFAKFLFNKVTNSKRDSSPRLKVYVIRRVQIPGLQIIMWFPLYGIVDRDSAKHTLQCIPLLLQ